MIRITWSAAPIAALLSVLAPALPSGTAGAQTVRTLDIGGAPGDTTARACLTDSLISAALTEFNNPAAIRIFGGQQTIPSTIGSSYNLYQGQLKLDGTVQGNVLVLNGGARVTRTGVVTGRITVIGGSLFVDPGARVGRQFSCDAQPSLTRLPDGRLARATPQPTIRSMTSSFAWNVGPYRFTPHLGVGQYNRVEALPVQVGADVVRGFGTGDTLRAELYGVGRTGRDASGSRSSLGWHGSATYTHRGSVPFSIAIEGGSTITPTADRPYTALESGLSALLLRRDYTDWYLRRGTSVMASVRPWHEVTLSGGFDISRQTTVLATEAFSLLRNTDPWRPNPLIDDGTYHTLRGRVIWDARDPELYPVLSWYVRAELRHVTSNDLTPVSLPTSIRDALPARGYAETEGELDVRGSLRISPVQRLNFRLAAGGYLGGDPLTIQRRRATGSADPMPGFGFRGINCDRQRKPLPSTPALCDRTASIQVEYRRPLAINLRTRIGGYTIGLGKPELVFFGDAGTAWLAGDSAGRVPANRIQSIGEWRSDVGVGITTGHFGIYLAKAVTDPIPVRLTLLFHPRF